MRPLVAGHVLEKVVILIKLEAEIMICKSINYLCTYVKKTNKIVKNMEIKKLYEIYKAHPVVTTDSRNCPEGSIFFALKGETFDGNKFAMQALEKGCAYAVADAP